MRTLRAWILRLGGTLRGNRRERELAAELESHFQLHIDDNIRAGMSALDARRAAVAKFGPVEAIKDDYRDRAGIPLLEIFLQDLRYAARRLRRQPGFTALVVLTLALGIGANTAMFGFVDTLLFRTPDHVRDPERLVDVQRASNYVRYQELTERVRHVELAAYAPPQTLSYGAGATASPLRTQCVTPSFFPLLGVTPPIGRGFTDADDSMASERTIVLAHGFWSRQFAANPAVIGTRITVASRPYTVIGIAPRGFKGLDLRAVDGWMLLAVSPEACSFSGTNLMRSDRGSWLSTVGRLQDGVTLPQAVAELAAAQTDRLPVTYSNGRVVETAAKYALRFPAQRVSLSPDARLSLWLAGGAAVLLLLACANIAGLLSMRAVDRRREVAIRLQIGGSRRRVFVQLLVEHLLTAALGGVAALFVALWMASAFRTFFPFGAEQQVLDLRMLAVLGALAVIAGLLSGTIPALQASRTMMMGHLRTGHAVAPGRARGRTALLVVQVAFALVLVVAAGLFVRSVQNFRGEFAYDLDHVITAAIDFQRAGTSRPADIHATFERLLEAVRRLPQVEHAALSSAPVLGSGGSQRVVFVRRSKEETNPDGHLITETTPEYFATLGLRLVSGRAFTDADRAGGRPVVILNDALAKVFFGAEDPIGQCVWLGGGKCAEVVGVSESFRSSARADDQTMSQIFMPMRVSDGETVPQVLLVRTRGSAAEEVAAVASALQGVSPDLPYVSVRPLLDLADVQARSWLLGATVFSVFGTLAVALAAIGIYGTLAFSIRQRTVEIGVRMALGALRSDVAGMVMRHAAFVLVLGCGLGAAGAFAASRFVRSLLFNVAPGDPQTFAIAVGVLAVAALAGCVLPAIRASRVDPAVALRYE